MSCKVTIFNDFTTNFVAKITFMLNKELIHAAARQVGFSLCGVAKYRSLDVSRDRFEHWLANGNGDGLDYLARNIDKRFDPALLVEGAKSVIICALNYRNQITNGYPAEARGKIASYACTTDYHYTIKAMLHELLGRLREGNPTLTGRVFVDSAPLAEKAWAVEAGLGWIGRQSLLITREYGSTVLLGALVVCDEVDSYDEPYAGNGCGDCRRCIDACPNSAILSCRAIDSRRCISRLTIERKVITPDGCSLHGWAFGCEECQNVCPHNHSKPASTLPAIAPTFDPRQISAEDWSAMSDEEFSVRFSRTPMARSGRERIVEALQKSISE